MASYTPISFLIHYSINNNSNYADYRNRIINKFSFKKNIILNSYQINILCNKKIFIDEKKEIVLILKGELYDTNSNTNEFIVNKYRKFGLSFIKELNGCFAFVLIDIRKEKLIAATDRVNSKKIFFLRKKDEYFLSSSIYNLPLDEIKIDLAGLSWYLINGAVFNNHTLIQNVNILPRSSITSIKRDEINVEKYWDLIFNYEYINKKENDLQIELYELLKECVKKRIKENNNIYISLSGGYDISAILGIIAFEMKIKEAECVSYYYKDLRSGSDVDVAKKQASLCNYNHRLINSFNDKDIFKNFEINAMWGESISNYCEEADFWYSLNPELSSSDNNILFTGDEIFGWVNEFISNDKDALRCLRIYDYKSAKILKNMIYPKFYSKLEESMNCEIDFIINKIPHFDEVYDRINYLYFDQRIPHVIMPWREFFSGRFIKTQNPFLDNSIIDFVSKLPKKYRNRKNLFIKTVRNELPQLFGINRAKFSNNVNNWNSLFNKKKELLNSEIINRDSILDNIINPKNINQLFTRNNGFEKIILPIRKYNRKLRRMSHIYFRGENLQDQVNENDILKRYLMLKIFYQYLSNINS